MRHLWPLCALLCSFWQSSWAAEAASARFGWFQYQGEDAVFAVPLKVGHYRNPVLAGFFPDPSITRRGDDFYLVNSSFSYLPGLPILHSKDLVNWQLIGHALTRPSQFEFAGAGLSRGIYAPTLRYHQGTFYLIGTVVDQGGNFILTATDPAGPWSDPIWLPEVGGIDPDLFFDEDGKVYISHNDAPPGEPLYEGHRAIWLWQFDPVAKKVKPESKRLLVNGGVDIRQQPIWIEGPHLYKHNGWYYLLCAEGGTADQHSAVIFRSRSLSEPFVPAVQNPILTQRDLAPDRASPITTAGHADFIQLDDGSWWAVFLAARAYQQRYSNVGRETYLLPVHWQDGWPQILTQGLAIPYQLASPASLKPQPVTVPQTGNFVWRDEFASTVLDLNWNWLRQFDQSWLQLKDGALHLRAKADRLESSGQPAFIGRRLQHLNFTASTALQLPSAGQSAGLVLLQNELHHYYIGARRTASGAEVFLEQAKGAKATQLLAEQLPAGPQELQLKVTGAGAELSFYYQLPGQGWQAFGPVQDGTVLSTQVAGGFVGSTLGLYSRLEDKP
ncbi:glycoside hydrolase family 43 protein [Rheinheimera marina]|uniref:Glycoside hydrolase family 43 protein n=1 Tax=Rheinheimera marina TaxID=1774958 RepID=A0ABV9JN38_9GAMM